MMRRFDASIRAGARQRDRFHRACAAEPV